MRNFKPTILFDLDGTLIDSTRCIVESFFYAFDAFGRPRPSEADIKRYIGYTLDDIFKFLGVTESDTDKFVRAYKQNYMQIYMDGTTLLPGAHEAVATAGEFANLGVVTTKSSACMDLLSHLGIGRFFSTIIGRDDVTHVKPHAEPILTALARLNAPKEHAYMIGDTSLDAGSAGAAQITAIGVTCGYESAESLAKICDQIYPDALSAIINLKQIYA